MNDITVIIHSYNEGLNIAEVIKSAYCLTESVIVVDMESTDDTVAIAKSHGAVVYTVPHQKYVEPAREFGINKAQSEWVFILDCDERIDDALAEEIRQVVRDRKKTHYRVPRKNFFLGKKWLRYGGWYPDYVVRLIHKASFQSWPAQIHAQPIIDGESGQLKNAITHYFHPSLENMVDKTAVYEEIESELLYKANKSASVFIFFRKFFGELYRRMIRQAGFFDGSYGVIEFIYQAYSKTITYLYLYEKKQKSTLV